MANPHRGEVSLTVGGKERTLRYSLNALAELQDRLNLTGMSQVTSALEDMDFRMLRVMLWAGLIHKDPDLRIEEVGSWEDLDIRRAARSITEALQLSFGAAGRAGNGQTPTARRKKTGTD